MGILQDLISQISDVNLRDKISEETAKLLRRKKFGLVFEEHLPECTPLYDVPIRVGTNVALKSGVINNIYVVTQIENENVTCVSKNDNIAESFAIGDLVAVASFGEPIYPYLKRQDNICNAPESDLWHTLIEADNYHALQLLQYLYAGKIDCIYIDPPYNSGAKDWKYNNDYVDEKDVYRHSKWLSMIKKRLLISKKLLKKENSALIVTIDEKEYLHLGCLLEQMFPEASIQMISITINPSGAKRDNLFSRADEYIYVLLFGDASVIHPKGEGGVKEVRWFYLRRTDYASRRGTVKGGASQFYPIYVDNNTKKIIKIGDPLAHTVDRHSVEEIPGATAVFPVREDGVEMNWGVTGDTLQNLLDFGLVRVSDGNEKQPYIFRYLSTNYEEKLSEGRWAITGTREDESKIVVEVDGKITRATTVWQKKQYDAGKYGTTLLAQIIGAGKFNFPKSLYSVHDTLNFFVKNNKNALILDFFAGSGTTLHAVNLLNAEDGGLRKCILVTNNEVSDKDAKLLRNTGHRPGDSSWEEKGICQSVTWPRTKLSIIGKNIIGNNLEGEYLSINKTYQNKKRNFHQIGFIENSRLLTNQHKKQIVSLIGNIPQSCVSSRSSYVLSENLEKSVIFNTGSIERYISELNSINNESISEFYIVTSDVREFERIKQSICDEIGDMIEFNYEKIPMRIGFKTNVEYFKLSFLDKTSVSLGQQFENLLPVIWLKAGGIGQCPTLESAPLPQMLIYPSNHMAILLDEVAFPIFEAQVNSLDNIKTVFIITDSDAGFKNMISSFSTKQCYQLYRDYLDNFRINIGR